MRRCDHFSAAEKNMGRIRASPLVMHEWKKKKALPGILKKGFFRAREKEIEREYVFLRHFNQTTQWPILARVMGTIGSIIVCIGIEGAFDKRRGISDHFVKITHKKKCLLPSGVFRAQRPFLSSKKF